MNHFLSTVVVTLAVLVVVGFGVVLSVGLVNGACGQ